MAIYPDASWTHTEDTIGKYFNAVKYSEGGSIWEEVAKAEVNDEPTLIVGIGGLANSTVNQIKEKYIRRINDPQYPGCVQSPASPAPPRPRSPGRGNFRPYIRPTDKTHCRTPRPRRS